METYTPLLTNLPQRVHTLWQEASPRTQFISVLAFNLAVIATVTVA